MPAISPNKPYRVGRSKTGLGLFATKPIKKGTKIVRYFGPLLDSKKKKDDAIENKYLFELTNRWTIDGSVRENVARYINHACKPNAESDVNPRKRKVFIRAIKNIEPGEEINYDYGTDYFKAYLKPIGCKCAACEKKRKKKRAEARAERLRLKEKAERKAKKKAEKLAGNGPSAGQEKVKAGKAAERHGQRRPPQRQIAEREIAQRSRRKARRQDTGRKARDLREGEGPPAARDHRAGPARERCFVSRAFELTSAAAHRQNRAPSAAGSLRCHRRRGEIAGVLRKRSGDAGRYPHRCRARTGW